MFLEHLFKIEIMYEIKLDLFNNRNKLFIPRQIVKKNQFRHLKKIFFI